MKVLIKKTDTPQAMKVQRVELTGMGRWNMTCFSQLYSMVYDLLKQFPFLDSSKTNKMQRYTMVFITINALHVSGSSSTHHQELKTVYTASGICEL